MSQAQNERDAFVMLRMLVQEDAHRRMDAEEKRMALLWDAAQDEPQLFQSEYMRYFLQGCDSNDATVLESQLRPDASRTHCIFPDRVEVFLQKNEEQARHNEDIADLTLACRYREWLGLKNKLHQKLLEKNRQEQAEKIRQLEKAERSLKTVIRFLHAGDEQWLASFAEVYPDIKDLEKLLLKRYPAQNLNSLLIPTRTRLQVVKPDGATATAGRWEQIRHYEKIAEKNHYTCLYYDENEELINRYRAFLKKRAVFLTALQNALYFRAIKNLNNPASVSAPVEALEKALICLAQLPDLSAEQSERLRKCLRQTEEVCSLLIKKDLCF